MIPRKLIELADIEKLVDKLIDKFTKIIYSIVIKVRAFKVYVSEFYSIRMSPVLT